MSSHKTDWVLSELRVFTQDWPDSYWIAATYSVLHFISQCTLSDKCTSKRMFLLSLNLYKDKQVACSVIVVCFYRFLYCTLLLVVYFLILSFFTLMLLRYFCLFIYHVNKLIIFVFVAFVYHFKNTISIFVTVLFHSIFVHLLFEYMVSYLGNAILNLGIQMPSQHNTFL